MAISKLHLIPVADLALYLNEGQIVAFNVGPEGNVYIVIARRPLDYRVKRRGGVSFSKTVPDVAQQYLVLSVATSKEIVNVSVIDAEFNVHMVQPVDGGLLLAGARSIYRRPDDFERNGHLFDSDGRLLRSILLGDGIQTIQATLSGVIWASFFDEGVFGNFGRNEPAWASGLVAWNGHGDELYRFVPTPGLDYICDCYALNIESEDTAWCYYYTTFPLVRLRNFTVDRYWQVPIAGSDAFAVAYGYVLFRGGYYQKDRYSLFSLPEKSEPILLREFELHTSKGERLKADRAEGRGDSIWLLSGSFIYRFKVEDALAN